MIYNRRSDLENITANHKNSLYSQQKVKDVDNTKGDVCSLAAEGQLNHIQNKINNRKTYEQQMQIIEDDLKFLYEKSQNKGIDRSNEMIKQSYTSKYLTKLIFREEKFRQ